MNAAARLYLAWLVALGATLGSLYFSEVRHFVPCTLCWYQRICMYPLAVLLGIAAYSGDLSVRRYALPLAGVGWLVALFHVLEERGVVSAPAACSVGVPCTVKWIEWWGFVTIPVLSLTAFTLLLALLAPPLRARAAALRA
ncbi:disulfide oxidoreductase [Deinococcus pimensis]|uniref:disulfide oxidoreductase n=1 Tax=Deinococcus pimensis TaxID=309888 RepID=UPI00048886DF|nr:disulfide oxidoreductase [Deinococcus pimensis]